MPPFLKAKAAASTGLKDRIHVFSLDYGTSKIRVSHRFARDGEDANANTIEVLELQKGTRTIPSEVGFVKKGDSYHFHWGSDLQKAMCLYPTNIQGDHRKILEEQLEKFAAASGRTDITTPEELIQLHLKQIREAAMAAVITRFGNFYPPDQIKRLSQRWSFTVPEIATLGTNQAFSQMIRGAGFPKGIMLMTETEAAAAWLMHEYSKTLRGLDNELEENDVVIILDAGGLTANITAIRITSAVQVGAFIAIEVVEKAGLACGSETLTKLLIQHIEDYANTHLSEHPGGFSAILQSLGMSRMQAEHQLARQFEGFKAVQNAKRIPLSLEGRNKITGLDEERNFWITGETVQGWLHNISGKMIDKLESVLAMTSRRIREQRGAHAVPKRRMLMPSGGLMRNSTILNDICTAYTGRNITVEAHDFGGQGDLGFSDPSVVKGASMRTVAGDPIFSDIFTLGFARDEPYDQDTHGANASTRKTADGLYVEDCWCTLVAYDAIGECTAARHSWTALCKYFIELGKPVLRDAIYLSTRPVEDSTPIKSKGKLLPEIQLYKAIEERIEPDLLRQRRQRTICSDLVHEVWARLTVTMEMTQIELKIELMDPKFDGDKHIDDDSFATTTILGGEKPSMLHDTAFPSALQRNPTQRGGRARVSANPGPPSPAPTTSRRSTVMDEETCDGASDTEAAAPSPKRRRTTKDKARRSGSSDREYKPHNSSPSSKDDSAGMSTRARRRG